MITDAQIGFKEGDLHLITSLLRRYPSVYRAVLFGSRAMGSYKQGSDVDIALFTDTTGDAATIRGELNDELSLPYKFDVLDYRRLSNADLIRNIDLNGLLIYEKEY
jgi:predicted nucleotidyltransferase